ncbi:single-stranded-DNA-specific exonuclease RecJ [Bacillota bacterium LX-D]|nr:single-stranded-DNA-specific exonuclease RecJ [Bacillota bacterium LX-D]
MFLIPKEWEFVEPDGDLCKHLSHELNIPSIVAQILINRGIKTIAEAQKLFYPAFTDLTTPDQLPDMQKAVKRINTAIKQRKRIIVYGDYDVDGITSTALMVTTLHSLGGNVDYYIPNRLKEGYGLNTTALQKIKNAKADLVITVDCGITSIDEVDFAKKIGLDIIITDHHEPGSEIPSAFAVINPKLSNVDSIQHLAGVGVAFKLSQALYMSVDLSPNVNSDCFAESILDLATLGTIADLVPLTGDNRIIVKYGLPLLSSSKRPGLRALIEVVGLIGKKITTNQVAFNLAPKLNAAGRLGSAEPALELLLTESEQRAKELAVKLNRKNEERQLIESQIYNEACSKIEEEVDFSKHKVIVLASPFWHQGIIGIVASKIVERFYRPVILLSIEGDKARGSGRSIKGFDLYNALKFCEDFLLKYGGHNQAAGMSLMVRDIRAFTNAINKYAEEKITEEMLQPILKIDSSISLEDIDYGLFEHLEKLAPFGFGNPEPVLCCSQVQLGNWKRVGKNNNHLKTKVFQNNKEFDAIGFNLAAKINNFDSHIKMSTDIAFVLEQNEWNGNINLQLNLKDLEIINNNCGFYSILGRNYQNLLDRLLKSMQNSDFFIIKTPLRRMNTGYYDFFESFLQNKGLLTMSIDSRHFSLEHDYSKYKVIFMTNVFWQKYGAYFYNSNSRIIDLNDILECDLKAANVIDSRGINKLTMLEKLFLTGRSLIVYLNYKKNALELENYFTQRYPSFKGQVKVLFKIDEGTDLNLLDNNFKLIITNQFLDFCHWSQKWDKVIYEPPFSPDELKFRVAHSENMNVYLLWNEQDLKVNDDMLKIMFPNKLFLEGLMNRIYGFSPHQRIDYKELMGDLNLAAESASINKLKIGLDILRELKVVYFKNGAFFLNTHDSKVDLENSACFKEGQLELSAQLQFKKFVSIADFESEVG